MLKEFTNDDGDIDRQHVSMLARNLSRLAAEGPKAGWVEEALAVLSPFAEIAPSVEYTDKRDGNIVHRQRVIIAGNHAGWKELTKDDFRRAHTFRAMLQASMGER